MVTRDMKKIIAWIAKYAFYIIFAQALISTLGSLYFSEVMNLAPCLLCWYQRIATYPIVLIAGFAIWYEDKKADRYILPLALGGFLISVYHNMLYYKILPEKIQPCSFGVSCTTPLINWLGFVTIPLLSLMGLALILGVLIIYRTEQKKSDS